MLIIRRGRGGQVVSAVESGSSAPESSVARDHCAGQTLTRPQSSSYSARHGARWKAQGWDARGDGKGEEKKTSTLAFSLAISPCAPTSRRAARCMKMYENPLLSQCQSPVTWATGNWFPFRKLKAIFNGRLRHW